MTLSGARLYTVESMMNHEIENIWMEAVTCREGKITKPSVSIDGVPCKTRTKYLPITSLKRYRYSQVQSDKSLLLCIYYYF
jgi:hypothetical protein